MHVRDLKRIDKHYPCRYAGLRFTVSQVDDLGKPLFML